MPSTNRDYSVPSVKLYPRLAMSNPSKKLVSNPRPSARRRRPPSAQELSADQIQVRARLLRMILENEQTRRNGQRPNAS
jgi:hypothetical protein